MLWRIREIELSSQIAEIRQHYADLDCQNDAACASNRLQGLRYVFASNCSSVAPTPEVRRANAGQPYAHEKTDIYRQKTTQASRMSDRISAMWKDIPSAIMTDSIGPLEDICILPDDPMITSIYMEK